MDYFKNMIYKDGKLDYSMIAVKGGFLLLAIIYTILFFIFKDIAITNYLYPANDFFLFHLIMFLPAIACVVFAVVSHSTRWLRVLWQMMVIMAACLVITACVAIFSGFKSETDNTRDYLILDGYAEGEDSSDSITPQSFEATIKLLMPATLDDTKSADYVYDYTSLPILGGYFDVSLKAKYNDDNFSSEISRLEKQYTNTKKLADKDNEHLTHYLIRAKDKPDGYFYVSYSVDSNKNTIYYYVCYSDRSSAVPLFEQDGFDFGRIGNSNKDEDITNVSSDSSAD